MKDCKKETWETTRLEDCVTFQTGKLNSNAAKPHGAYPFFTCSQETYWTDTFSFDTECVLLAGNNANGIYPLKYFNGKFDAYQRTYVIRSKDAKELDNRYLYFALSPKLDFMRSISTGAATKFLTLAILKDITINKPPIEVQRRIVSVLSAYDDLIENNTRRIKILEEMAQMIYREWFANFRFPGYEKCKHVGSGKNAIPSGWTTRKLADIAGVNEHSIKSGDHIEDIVYIDIASVSTARIDNKVRLRLDDAPGRARRIVRHGDIIWSTVRPNRRSFALILRPEDNLIVSTGFAVLTAREVPYTFLYFATTTEEFSKYLTNHAKGSAYPAVSASDFEDAKILCPSKNLLDEFHSVTSGMMDLQQCLHLQNSNLMTTRDLLLPKLISGEINVEHFETESAAQTV